MRSKEIWIVVFLSVSIAGCSLHTVRPWERATLARDDMQVVPDPVEGNFDEQIYFAREAAFGGRGVGGGGCGCN